MNAIPVDTGKRVCLCVCVSVYARARVGGESLSLNMYQLEGICLHVCQIKMPGSGERVTYVLETDFRLGMGSKAIIRAKALNGGTQLSVPGLITPFFKPKPKAHHSIRGFWFVNDL